MTEISQKIRQVTEEDKGLPYLSYSKESNFDHCPLSHKLKYIDKNFSKKSSLPMEIGSILHKALELKGRMKYFDEFFTADSKSGMNYSEKMDIFYNKVLPSRIDSKEWTPVAVEQRFEFVYDDRVIIHGFIDRVDKNAKEQLRITDYKSSKAVFRDADIKTPMQHVIYDLACIHLYGQPATADEGVCTKGYLMNTYLNSLIVIMFMIDIY